MSLLWIWGERKYCFSWVGLALCDGYCRLVGAEQCPNTCRKCSVVCAQWRRVLVCVWQRGLQTTVRQCWLCQTCASQVCAAVFPEILMQMGNYQKTLCSWTAMAVAPLQVQCCHHMCVASLLVQVLGTWIIFREDIDLMFVWAIVCQTVTLHCTNMQFTLFVFTARLCHILKEEQKPKKENKIKT
jgi:hypothetical protein